jgi:hypothetical protein
VAILTAMKIHGDPDELLKLKQEKVDPISREVAPRNGGLEHLVARTDDGLLIVNIWESAEGMQKTAQEITPMFKELGLPAPTDWQQFELLQRETP